MKLAYYSVAVPFSICLQAISISLMWVWFIVPLGAVPISMGHAYGLSCFVSVFNQPDFSKKPDTGIRTSLASFIWRILLLAVAWCVHSWWAK